LLPMFTAPLCPLAQPLHHRLFPSAGSPRLDVCGDSSNHSLYLINLCSKVDCTSQETLCKLGAMRV
jgi:hypothetical protein